MKAKTINGLLCSINKLRLLPEGFRYLDRMSVANE